MMNLQTQTGSFIAPKSFFSAWILGYIYFILRYIFSYARDVALG